MESARDEMEMQMGDRLADLVVDHDQRSIRTRCRLNRLSQSSGGSKDWLDQVRRQIRKSFMMVFRHEKGVAGEQRPYIEEGERPFFVENHVGGDFAGNDLTEEAHGRRD
jgi:hypothetical protein